MASIDFVTTLLAAMAAGIALDGTEVNVGNGGNGAIAGADATPGAGSVDDDAASPEDAWATGRGLPSCCDGS